MNKILYNDLIELAKKHIKNDDPSHDVYHALRVLKTVELISRKESGDLDVLVPAALFHDVINYPKNSLQSSYSADESAIFTKNLLSGLKDYSSETILKVEYCIRCCSFSKGIVPDLLEAKILQDADMLESTGAISIMRTFSSAGQYGKPFYDESDPFCDDRKPDASLYALDLCYSRLLKVNERMYTKTAKLMAEKRKLFLEDFLSELRGEISLDF